MEMDNDPNHTAKATQKFYKLQKYDLLQWLISNQQNMLCIVTADTSESTEIRNKQQLKAASGKAWQSVSRQETQYLMSMSSTLQAVTH